MKEVGDKTIERLKERIKKSRSVIEKLEIALGRALVKKFDQDLRKKEDD